MNPAANRQNRHRKMGAIRQAAFEQLENRRLLSAGTGLLGNYTSRVDANVHYLARVDPTINFSVSSGSADAALPTTNWAAEWTGQVKAPVTGNYTFSTISDDGIRVWVNGQQIINDWSDHPPTTDQGIIALAAGQLYDIKVDFYQGAGGATCILNWSAPGLAQQVVPQSALFAPATAPGPIPPPPPSTVNGLLGTYFNNNNPSTPALTRVDPTVNFDWSTTSPAPTVGLYQYNVEWTGQVLAPISGNYTFTTTSDDGLRLSVNNQLIINDWNNHPATVDNGNITLVAGQKYDIKLDYMQTWGGAVCKLAWAGPGFSTQIIPQGNLFTPGTGSPTPDSQAPTVPTGLVQQSVTASSDTIKWSPSSDNIGVTGYTVFRNGAQIGAVDGGTTTFTDIGLAASTNYIYTLLAFDAAGNKSAQSIGLPVTTQASAPLPPPNSGNGLLGTYYNSNTPGTPAFVRIDPVVNFDWTNAPPRPLVALYNYNVEWTGRIMAPTSGSYTFSTTSDDGVRLWVNGQQLINDWSAHPATVDQGSITLLAGQLYDIKLDYYQGYGGAVCSLAWAGPPVAKQIVPQADLYTPPGTDAQAPTVPTGLRLSASTDSTATLQWNPSTDNNAVAGYSIYRDGVKVGTVASGITTFVDSGLLSNTFYKWSVAAFDSLQNLSVQCPPVSGTTTGLPGGPTQPPIAGSWYSVFNDNFDSLDTTVWTNGRYWWNGNNGTQATFDPGQVSVGNGVLNLTANKIAKTDTTGATKPYTSALLQSGGIAGVRSPGFSFKYGYVETRAKIAPGVGMWSALWMLPVSHNDTYELDVHEILGRDPTTFNGFDHFNGKNAKSTIVPLGYDTTAAFHVYGLDWEPDHVTWYVDGQAVGTYTNASVIPQEAMYLIFNLDVGGDWAGPLTVASPSQSTWMVDYVRVFQH